MEGGGQTIHHGSGIPLSPPNNFDGGLGRNLGRMASLGTTSRKLLSEAESASGSQTRLVAIDEKLGLAARNVTRSNDALKNAERASAVICSAANVPTLSIPAAADSDDVKARNTSASRIEGERANDAAAAAAGGGGENQAEAQCNPSSLDVVQRRRAGSIMRWLHSDSDDESASARGFGYTGLLARDARAKAAAGAANAAAAAIAGKIPASTVSVLATVAAGPSAASAAGALQSIAER
ncbi:unnamed protein product, partial [Phaeothamnion confervicola]